MAKRKITFTEAKRKFPARFTMEHVPEWAKKRCVDGGGYYAPQYETDREWYENTFFPGEKGVPSYSRRIIETNKTWPLGGKLKKPFTVPVKERKSC